MYDFLLVLAGGAVSLVTSATVTWLQGRYARRSESRSTAREATRQLTGLLIAEREASGEAASSATLAEAELLVATITHRRTREAVRDVIRLLRTCELPEFEQLSGVRSARARQLLCDHGLNVLGAHLRSERPPAAPDEVRRMLGVENEALNIHAGGVPASASASAPSRSRSGSSGAASAKDTPSAESAAVSSRKVRNRPRGTRKNGDTDEQP